MIELFLELLMAATANIAPSYFRLAVAGKADAIYRERVYCYELYHQLRLLLVQRDLGHYILSGEVDKSGHPLIRPCIPDFVFHVPGDMRGNLIVTEVKPVNARKEGIQKDLDTLSYFVSAEVGYECGVHLIYGEDANAMADVIRAFEITDHRKLQLFWHARAGDPARRIK